MGAKLSKFLNSMHDFIVLCLTAQRVQLDKITNFFPKSYALMSYRISPQIIFIVY